MDWKTICFKEPSEGFTQSETLTTTEWDGKISRKEKIAMRKGTLFLTWNLKF
jgi:hypothetical protein